MTPVGHSLVSSTIAVLMIPEIKKSRYILFLFLFIIAGNFPDIPLSFWGHSNYEVSHSLFMNSGLMIIFLIALSFNEKFSGSSGGIRIFMGIWAALLSHFLLDSFYAHARGIAIFLPFSEARLNLPIRYFRIVGGFPIKFDYRLLKILSIEFIFYFPFLLLAIGIRFKKSLSKIYR